MRYKEYRGYQVIFTDNISLNSVNDSWGRGGNSGVNIMFLVPDRAARGLHDGVSSVVKGSDLEVWSVDVYGCWGRTG